MLAPVALVQRSAAGKRAHDPDSAELVEDGVELVIEVADATTGEVVETGGGVFEIVVDGVGVVAEVVVDAIGGIFAGVFE